MQTKALLVGAIVFSAALAPSPAQTPDSAKAVGEACLITNPGGPVNWTRTFIVQ